MEAFDLLNKIVGKFQCAGEFHPKNWRSLRKVAGDVDGDQSLIASLYMVDLKSIGFIDISEDRAKCSINRRIFIQQRDEVREEVKGWG